MGLKALSSVGWSSKSEFKIVRLPLGNIIYWSSSRFINFGFVLAYCGWKSSLAHVVFGKSVGHDDSPKKCWLREISFLWGENYYFLSFLKTGQWNGYLIVIYVDISSLTVGIGSLNYPVIRIAHLAHIYSSFSSVDWGRARRKEEYSFHRIGHEH